jgi:hypothetical protein
VVHRLDIAFQSISPGSLGRVIHVFDLKYLCVRRPYAKVPLELIPI